MRPISLPFVKCHVPKSTPLDTTSNESFTAGRETSLEIPRADTPDIYPFPHLAKTHGSPVSPTTTDSHSFTSRHILDDPFSPTTPSIGKGGEAASSFESLPLSISPASARPGVVPRPKTLKPYLSHRRTQIISVPGARCLSQDTTILLDKISLDSPPPPTPVTESPRPSFAPPRVRQVPPTPSISPPPLPIAHCRQNKFTVVEALQNIEPPCVEQPSYPPDSQCSTKVLPSFTKMRVYISTDPESSPRLYAVSTFGTPVIGEEIQWEGTITGTIEHVDYFVGTYVALVIQMNGLDASLGQTSVLFDTYKVKLGWLNRLRSIKAHFFSILPGRRVTRVVPMSFLPF